MIAGGGDPSAPAAQPEPTVEEILAENERLKEAMKTKDESFGELRSRAEQLEKSNIGLVERLSEVINAEPIKPAEKTEVKSPMPDGFDDMSDSEKISALASVVASSGKSVEEILAKHDDELRKNLAPVVSRVLKSEAALERKQISDEHPKFDWDKHDAEIAKLREEMPNLRLYEAVKIVADPAELVKPTSAPPPSLASVPSASVASSSGAPQHRAANPQQNALDESLTREGKLMDASATARMRGSRIESDKLLEGSLKERLFGQGGLRRAGR
jgi:hypothetical protein